MRIVSILLAGITLAPYAIGESIVHPTLYTSQDATAGNNSFPFRFSNGGDGRYQQAHDASQFQSSIVITEIAFRYKGDSTVPASGADFKLTMAYSANPWNGLSQTFAANVGGNPTVVFDGVWNFPGFAGDPAEPNPFTNRLTLSTPFKYDPAQGDLLLDVEMRAASPNAGGSFARADNLKGVSRVYDANDINSTTGVGSGTGLIIELTTTFDPGIEPYGAGCEGSGGCVPELLMNGTPAPGQQINLSLSNGLGGAQSFLFVGTGALSAPIGSGCSLLVANTLIHLAIPLGGAGPCNGSYTFPSVIPPNTPAGVTIYLQAFVADPAKPVGIAASNGLKIEIQ